MTRYQDTRRLLATWDELLGDALLGDEGIESSDDFWLPLVAHTIQAVLEEDDDGRAAETTTRIVQSLVALDLADTRTWARFKPGGDSDEATLVRLVMQQHGVGPRASATCVAAVALLADHWQDHVKQVRHLVRERTTRLADDFDDLVPSRSFREIGLTRPDDIVRHWAESTLGIPSSWSETAQEFADKFDLSTSDLEQIAYRLDRSCERLDVVVNVFMDELCRDCDPAQHPRCVAEAGGIDVDVSCPLLVG